MNKEQTENLIKMLQSEDSENHILALGILETTNPKTIEIPLMLCYKFGIPDSQVWIKEAPNCAKHLRTLGEVKPYVGFSFQQIFTVITDSPNIEDLEIFLTEYGKYLTKASKNPKIEAITISIKLKEDEPF